MSNGSTKQGGGLSAPCIGCLIIGLVIGLFAGAFLPTLFSGGPSHPPAQTGPAPATGPRDEGYGEQMQEGAEAMGEMVEETAEDVADQVEETLPDEMPGADDETQPPADDPDAPGQGGGG
jgi:hypothetical protein